MSDHCVLCGLPISRANMKQTLDGLLKRISRGEGAWLLTLNTEMLSRFTRDPSYRNLVARADIITADGMPLVWASRFRGANQAISERTTGVDLVDAYLRLPQIPTYAIIGGVDPATTIASYGTTAQQACGYLFDGKVDLSDEQVHQFVAKLHDQQVRMLFLALGVPRGDQLAVKISTLMPKLIVIGVGGTFEILGPQGGRAPRWMQKAGMEWLFRLAKEPGRLWKRYLLHYPAGISLLIRDSLRNRWN
jgi:N-acetylglucosaminyldiphosphoundecaprenol N-acetyl-beta-D-mannosaminyltransferase